MNSPQSWILVGSPEEETVKQQELRLQHAML
jgi:hypothetical protein